jgi:hypothetical protein
MHPVCIGGAFPPAESIPSKIGQHWFCLAWFSPAPARVACGFTIAEKTGENMDRFRLNIRRFFIEQTISGRCNSAPSLLLRSAPAFQRA